MRKVCVVTGSRAEYGLLSGLMEALKASNDFELLVVVSAMHLSPEFGLTYKEIEADGFDIDERVEMLVSGSTAAAVAKSIGLGVIGFSDTFSRLRPDLIVLLGDRFEALAAAQTAMMMTIPLAHIHGGEVTEGAVDESIRHAITKMANLHFVATQEFKNRVVQLGEQPSRVVISGALGIDNIMRVKPMTKSELESTIGFKIGPQNFLVTYHPVTLSLVDEKKTLLNLLRALDSYPDSHVIITYPNADAEGQSIISELKAYAQKNRQRVFLTESLGFRNYLSALPHMDCVVGNSSSGLIEVPSFKIPTVNIGERQKGRPLAASVIGCDETAVGIRTAIEKALSDSFQLTLSSVTNPYGEGDAVRKIMDTLRACDVTQFVRKPFFDIDFEV